MADEPTDPDYRQIAHLLDEAKGTVTDDRGDTHGHPRENLRHTARMWSAYLQKDVTDVDVAMMMVMQKISRQKKGSPAADHFTDMCGYASIGGTLATRDVEAQTVDDVLADADTATNRQFTTPDPDGGQGD